MNVVHMRSHDLADFERIAAELAKTLLPGDAVALSGDLGSGKTTFARAIVKALQGEDVATSPTFTFRHRYPGPPVVEHLDLYRIDDAAEIVELGLEEAFAPEAYVLVEWPERLPGLIPRTAIRVTLRGAGQCPREVTIERPCRS